MRGLVKCLVLSAALCVLVGCQPGPTTPEVTFEQRLANAGLQCFWDFALPLDRGETITRARLLDENLYCLTSNNRLVAIDAARGVVLWSQPVAEAGKTVYDLRHYDQLLISPAPAVSGAHYWTPLIRCDG